MSQKNIYLKISIWPNIIQSAADMMQELIYNNVNNLQTSNVIEKSVKCAKNARSLPDAVYSKQGKRSNLTHTSAQKSSTATSVYRTKILMVDKSMQTLLITPISYKNDGTQSRNVISKCDFASQTFDASIDWHFILWTKNCV